MPLVLSRWSASSSWLQLAQSRPQAAGPSITHSGTASASSAGCGRPFPGLAGSQGVASVVAVGVDPPGDGLAVNPPSRRRCPDAAAGGDPSARSGCGSCGTLERSRSLQLQRWDSAIGLVSQFAAGEFEAQRELAAAYFASKNNPVRRKFSKVFPVEEAATHPSPAFSPCATEDARRFLIGNLHLGRFDEPRGYLLRLREVQAASGGPRELDARHGRADERHLPRRQPASAAADIGAVLLARPDRLFSDVRPSRVAAGPVAADRGDGLRPRPSGGGDWRAANRSDCCSGIDSGTAPESGHYVRGPTRYTPDVVSRPHRG